MREMNLWEVVEGVSVEPPCRVVSTRADGAFEFALKMARAGYKINLSGVNGELWTVIVNEAGPTDKEGK